MTVSASVTGQGGGTAAIGNATDAAAPTGDGSVIALLKAHRISLAAIAAAAIVTSGVVTAGRLDTAPAKATAVAPTYTEGSSVALSTDLAGALRTAGGGGGGGNPTAGRLDSIRRLDSLRYLVAGRLDSLEVLDTVRSLRALFGTNPLTAGAIDEPARSSSALPVRDVDENWSGVYSFSLVDQAGVAAANNFLCLFNLAGSNDTIVVLSAWVSSYSVAAAITKNSIRMTRVSTCTVGTLQGAAAVNKYIVGYPNATSEVRTGNPTVTAAAEVIAWPPNMVITAAGTTAAGLWDWTPTERMELRPGEGVVFRQTIAGDVDQTYNIRIAWAERQH